MEATLNALITLGLWVGAVVWVYADARSLRQRGARLTPVLWAILTILALIVLPIYLILRFTLWKRQINAGSASHPASAPTNAVAPDGSAPTPSTEGLDAPRGSGTNHRGQAAAWIVVSSLTVFVAIAYLPRLMARQPQTENRVTAQSLASAVAGKTNPVSPPAEDQSLDDLIRAANAGDGQAQGLLAERYMDGSGVPEDPGKALEWCQKAVAQGNANGQNDLGLMYAFGIGVAKDPAKAMEWFQKAADQGNSDAECDLGWIYEHGTGVSKDPAKAVEWYRKASAQGNSEGQFSLGCSYNHGTGVPKDEARAVEWYQKAAAQGHARAQHALGVSYFKGEGVAKSLELAYAWSNLGAAQDGDTELRDKCEESLAPEERAEGQRLASSWRKGEILGVSSDAAGDEVPPDGAPARRATGTAFVVSGEGHLLTNYHVVAGCTEVKVAGHDGTTRVIAVDKANDLALLQLPEKTKDCVSLSPEVGRLREGEDIAVFGYPLNGVLSSGGNITSGTISAMTGLDNNTTQLQITAPIQPGSSGSPVLDRHGNVVGIVSSKLNDAAMADATGQIGQNVNFAVNGQTVKAFLDVNHVPYKTGGWWALNRSNADMAQDARKWTVLVECWR